MSSGGKLWELQLVIGQNVSGLLDGLQACTRRSTYLRRSVNPPELHRYVYTTQSYSRFEEAR